MKKSIFSSMVRYAQGSKHGRRAAKSAAKASRKNRGRTLHLERLEARLAPATLWVNTTADNTTDTSVLTLRDAITLVNNAGDPASLVQSSMPSGWASQIDTTNPFGTSD